MAFPVFTSYAQADRGKHLKKFIEEFREELGGLLGQVDRTAIVFFDRDGVKAGDPWNETSIEAVRNAKVLICFMSPTYLWREHRGIEITGSEKEGTVRYFAEQLSSFGAESAWENAPAADIDNPQKGCRGGLAERNGRRLTATVWAASNDWFQGGLVVERIDGGPLKDEVEYHLHPGFHPSVIRLPPGDDIAHLRLYEWGAFTVGLSADNGRTNLDLNLAELPDTPEEFKTR